MSTRLQKNGDESFIQGVGLGLRTPHYHFIESTRPDVAWFEVLIDNYMQPGGSPLYHLERIARDYALTFHGVGMSLGSADPLNMDYLGILKQRINEFKPAWVSDHLCWSSVAGCHGHELLPLPYTEEAVALVIEKIRQVQDYLGQRILIENVSSYLTYTDSQMPEWEFLNIIACEADCDILLDINNIYVSSVNHNLDAELYLQSVPVDRVREMHLAGYEDAGTHLLDTHSRPVYDPVWDLYRKALRLFGTVPTLIEWDNDIPEFDILVAEADKARSCMRDLKNAVA
ncbi:MAG: DUF692 domain-containing protein [Gammaproteobacteria bacterium]|nr:DUF692 domain-containing protein [Gammaproteobacteria bacterium]